MKKIIILLSLFLFFCQCCLANNDIDNVAENNYLKITKEKKFLKSRLNTLYDGYEYCIKNITDGNVVIKRIDIWSNASAKVAYLSVKQTNKTAAAQTFEKGKKYAVRTLGLSLIAYGFASPFSAISNDIGNTNAEKEANFYDKQNIIDYKLKPNESIHIKTMAMKRHSPVFKLIFVNPITDDNMDILLK